MNGKRPGNKGDVSNEIEEMQRRRENRQRNKEERGVKQSQAEEFEKLVLKRKDELPAEGEAVAC